MWRVAARAERHVTLRRHRFPELTKFDIVNRLGTVNGYSSYLELATPTTGNKYTKVDRGVFTDCRRVIYRASPDAAEFPTDVVSTSLDSRDGVAVAAEADESFDVVFVDPHHDRTTSRVDIEQGLEVLAPGGVMVVHDCLPPRKSMAGDTFERGEWVGQTYLAFLDVMSHRPDLEFCVVDTHWGVGIVWRRADGGPRRHDMLPPEVDIGSVDYDRWTVFRRRRRELMRTITPKRFDEIFGSTDAI